MRIVSYRQLLVWQRSMELIVACYELTRRFPNDERFGLTSQMRRAAISIASNIAEGRLRGTKGEFVYFLRVAYASGAELETQLEIARRLHFGDQPSSQKAEKLLNEVMKMLNAMLRTLKQKH